MHIFRNLNKLREHSEQQDYNEKIPHDSLGNFTPVECRSFVALRH